MPGYTNPITKPLLIFTLPAYLEEIAAQPKHALHDYFAVVIIHDADTHSPSSGGNLFPGITAHCLQAGQGKLFDPGPHTEGTTILFRPEFLQLTKDEVINLLHAGLFSMYQATQLLLSDDRAVDISQLLASLQKEYDRGQDANKSILQTLLKLLLMQLKCFTASEQVNNVPAGDIYLVSRFLEMVNTHFMSRKKVVEYARELRVVPNYLNIKVKKVTGMTASYHIQQRVIVEAKRRAQADYMNLKEIAYTLGYDDLSHFSKFFKKFSGMSFSDFKKIGA